MSPTVFKDFPWPSQSVSLDRSRYAEFLKTIPDRWFAVTPHPDDRFILTFKAGEVPAYIADEADIPSPAILEPPPLSDERRKQIDVGVLSRVLLERRIVWNMIHFLSQKGFAPKCVRHDYDEKTPDALSMLNEVFSLDEADCIFVNQNGRERGVRIVLGNDGYDCISDWAYGTNDPDGFNAAMEAFTDNTERFII